MRSAIDCTLGDNLENLTLTGNRGIDGTGNALANVLTGNDGDNRLDGKAGNDTLEGGAGDDTYAFARGDGQDQVDNRNATAGRDVIEFGPDIAQNQLWFQQSGGDLVVSVIGSADKLTIEGWYASEDNKLDAFALADGTTLYAGQVNQLVSAMAAFAPPGMGQATLPSEEQAPLNPWLGISWQNVQSATNSGRGSG